MSAQRRPAMLNDLLGEVMVMVRQPRPGRSDSKDLKVGGAKTKSACTSSETTSISKSSAIVAIAVNSSAVHTRPTGLCGWQSNIIRGRLTSTSDRNSSASNR